MTRSIERLARRGFIQLGGTGYPRGCLRAHWIMRSKTKPKTKHCRSHQSI